MTSIASRRVFSLLQESEAASVILKLVGEVCNLDCAYCYEKRKPYAGSRQLSADIVATFLRSIPQKRVAIELHGGEPLLYGKERFTKLATTLLESGKDIVRLTMQTNGTLLDDSYLSFLRATFPAMQLGISCDGPGELNAMRVDLSSNGSIGAVERALQACAAQGQTVGVITVVTQQSLGKATALLRYLATFSSVRAVKIVPCFDYGVRQEVGPKRRRETSDILRRSNGQYLPWAISPAQYQEFLDDAWAWWVDQAQSPFVLEPFLSVLKRIGLHQPSNCHFSSKKCSHVFTLYPDGTVGACDELDRRQHQYESPLEDPATSSASYWSKALETGRLSELIAKCSGCTAATLCGGGCVATRMRFSREEEENYCRHRTALVNMVQGSVHG